MRSSSHVGRYSLPSPPADFDELEFSADSDCCWQSQTDPCRSVHPSHAVEHSGGHVPSPMVKSQRFPLDRYQSRDVRCVYPSPPSTTSQAKHPVPLPEEVDDIPSLFTVVDACGVLDSSPALRNIPRNHFPLSPPPTIPTTTHALPEPDSLPTSPRDDGDQALLPSPDSDSGDLPPPGPLNVDFDNDGEALSDESDPGGSLEPLLSPLSPEWSTKISNLASASDLSDSLSEPSSLTFGDECRELLSSESQSLGSSSPGESVDSDDILDILDFPISPMEKTDHSWHSHQRSETQNEWSCWINDHDLPYSSHSSINSSDDSPSPPWFSHFSASLPGKPIPSETDIPHAQHTLISSADSDSTSFGYTYRPVTSSVASDRDEDMPGALSSSLQCLENVDSRFSFMPNDRFDLRSPPSFEDHFLPEPPSSESLPSLSELTEVGPSVLPPLPSPSRRSCSTLPSLEDQNKILRKPASPSQTLLSLPGSETDDELIPSFAPGQVKKLPNTSLSPNHGLMLMDDQVEGYAQRSPSPELFDIELDLDDDIYPEFEQLCELRKKALSAERMARHTENQMLERRAFNQRAEARRQRKREKERAKEIGALLRLKLGNDKVAILQEEERRPKNMATTLPRLVAQMVFRRHDTNKPLSTRHLPHSMTHGYVPSSLSQMVLSNFSIV